MIQTLTAPTGLTLHAFHDSRFKQGCLSIQFIAPMTSETAAMNALIPAVLLRGTQKHPTLRSITEALDSLYGAAVSPMARRVGDHQAVGFYCAFIDDRFALDGDAVFAPLTEFLGELLLESPLQDGGFLPDFVELEKKNQISAVEAEGNDKRTYAMNQTISHLCRGDSFAVPRMGTTESIAAITPKKLRLQYEQLLKTAPIEVFYVGSKSAEEVAARIEPIFAGLSRQVQPLPEQSDLAAYQVGDLTETQEITQGKLCMSYVTPITSRCEDFAAMQVLNVLFGGGMTSKLFQNVREKLSLCYSISSSYYSTKGILLVSAGIDFDKEALTRAEIEKQLADCVNGVISPEELTAAKEALCSGLRGAHDSPSAIEGYYQTSFLSGHPRTTAEHMAAVQKVTLEDVVAAAKTLTNATSFFLKGGSV